MKAIRIFVSSPGDVKDERETTETIIRRISSEYGLPVDVRYSTLLRQAESSPEESNKAAESDQADALVLCPYFWEYQRMQGDQGYQEQIPKTDLFDLVVCILWSRMGSQPGPELRNPDGSTPRSGTEYEIQWALDARHRSRAAHPDTPPLELTPALHIYRNTSVPMVAVTPENKKLFEQKDNLDAFISKWQLAEDGSFKAAFNSYRDLGEFERKFEAHMRDFLELFLPKQRTRLARPPKPLWNPSLLGSPFRRLDVYDVEHEPIFCGRHSAIGQVLSALRHQHARGAPFVLILGASGSGKSSLARAGVLPMVLKGCGVDGFDVWRHAILRPGAQEHGGNPCLALAAALLDDSALPTLRDPTANDAVGKLGQQLALYPDSFVDRIEDQLNFQGREKLAELRGRLERRIRAFAGRNRPGDAAALEEDLERLNCPRAGLFIIVDQAEELFHSDRDPALVASFVSALANLARSTRVMVLITLRSDYYDHFQRSELLPLTQGEGRVDLLPPGKDEIGQVIRLPAAAAALRYEENAEGKSLDEELRDHARTSPDSLPLLSHLLDLLFEKQKARGDGWLRWRDYEDLGCFSGALSQHAELIHEEKLTDTERAALHAVFGGLVHFGHGDRGEDLVLRKDAKLRTLVADTNGGEIPGARSLIEKLCAPDARLLSMRGGDSGDEPTVSISHEVLLRQWPRIRDWLRGNEHLVRLQQTVAPDAANWNDHGKPDDLLIRNTLRLEKLKPLLDAAFCDPVVVEYVISSLRSVEADEIASLAARTTVADELDSFRKKHPQDFEVLLDRLLTKEAEATAVNSAASLLAINHDKVDLYVSAVFARLTTEVMERRLARVILQYSSDTLFSGVDAAVSKSGAAHKWAMLLTVSDRTSRHARARDWLRRNRAGDWSRILWKSKLIRIKLTVPEFIVCCFLGVFLTAVGAGIGKFNTAFGHSAVQDRPFVPVGVFEGVLAAIVLGGPVLFGLVAYSGIFSICATPRSLFRPFLPIVVSSLLGLVGGVLVSLVVLMVCSEQTLLAIGWREGGHDSLFLRPFLDPANLRGWIFPVTSIGFGIGMGCCANLIAARTSASTRKPVLAPLRSFRELLGLLASSVRHSFAVMPILAIPLALAVFAAYSLQFPLAVLLDIDGDFLAQMFSLKVETPAKPSPADMALIKEWKASPPGMLAGISGDAFTKLAGGFGGLVGIFFGKDILRRGLKLDTQDEV